MKLAKHTTFFKTVAAALLLLALAACGTTATATSAPTVAPTQTLAPAPISTVTPDSTESPEPTPPATTTRLASLTLNQALAPLSMEFEGDGVRETEQFIVAQGVLVLMANYEGDGRFQMTITSDGRDSEPSIDVVGPYFGNLLFTVIRKNIDGLASGAHGIKVDADGPWRIRLFQDFPAIGQDPKIQFGGVGDGGGGWMGLEEGAYTIRASHDGESHFQVKLHEANGAPEALVINEPGPFDETISLIVSEDPSVSNVAPGIYSIGVRADGIWSVIVEDADDPAS